MSQVDRVSHAELGHGPGPPPEPPTLRTRVDPPAAASRGETPARVRRMEQAIVRIDPRSVANLSIGFYWRMLAFGMGLGVLLWLAALVTGLAGSIDTFIQDLSGYPSLTVLGFQGLLVALVLGLTFVVGGALVAVLAVVVFNLASDLGGGVKMTVMETELDEGLIGRGSTEAVGNEPSGPPPRSQQGRPRGAARRRPVLGADVTSLNARADVADAASAEDPMAHRSDQRPAVLRGVLVVGVENDSPAASAGLKDGDVIVSVDGTSVDSPASLSEALSDRDSDAATEMSWVDGHGRYRTAIAHLGERPG